MKIIISPAKKMIEDTDSFDISKLPIFKDKAEVLLTWLKSKNYDELKNIWKCNDKIAKLNYDRVQDMNLWHIQGFNIKRWDHKFLRKKHYKEQQKIYISYQDFMEF